MARRTARWVGAAAAVIAAAVLVIGCARDTRPKKPAEPTVTIRQKGAAAMWVLSSDWSEVFAHHHPGVQFDLHYLGEGPGGSGRAIKDLIEGNVEIANTTRPVTAEEIAQAQAAGVNLVEHLVGYDAIVVSVHEQNPLTKIDMRTLSDIFSGRVTSWTQVPGVMGLGDMLVYIREPDGSATYEQFKRVVVTLDGAEPDRDYGPNTLREPWDELIATAIPDDPNSIGYHGLANVGWTFLKPLALVPLGGTQAIAPTLENVISGAYPLSLELFCYTNGEPTGVLKEYLDFIKSLDGQAVVEGGGLVPLPEAREGLAKRKAEARERLLGHPPEEPESAPSEGE